ncbi:Dna-mediated transposase [Oopsacas minuta]|uniref:Dna-mediated transposase n=1 Tax=Oopsacas minuta TaxID=111878 RepID=A0AAV7KC01_9METZ|nr:Dna-mediated transposase [Oopsacas minuta]
MPRDLRIHFNNFSWAHVTPTLHKLLVHAPQIFADHNDGFGLEELSEEGLESCSKLFRRYRERLSRKFNFEDNVKDVFVRLISQSDPILASFRNITKNDPEPDLSELKSCQDILVNSLSITTL